MDEKFRAGLKHIAAGSDLQDFGGTKFEHGAFVATAVKRGLIAWDKKHGKYGLTGAGRRRLSARNPIRLPRLHAGKAVRLVAVGCAAIALGAGWFYLDVVHNVFGGPTAEASSSTGVASAAPGRSVEQRIERVAARGDGPTDPPASSAAPQRVEAAAAAPSPAGDSGQARTEPPAAAPIEPTPPAATTNPNAPRSVSVETPAPSTAVPGEESTQAHHRPRHGAHHRRYYGVDRAFADFNRFARRLFSALSAPNQRRR